MPWHSRPWFLKPHHHHHCSPQHPSNFPATHMQTQPPGSLRVFAHAAVPSLGRATDPSTPDPDGPPPPPLRTSIFHGSFHTHQPPRSQWGSSGTEPASDHRSAFVCPPALGWLRRDFGESQTGRWGPRLHALPETAPKLFNPCTARQDQALNSHIRVLSLQNIFSVGEHPALAPTSAVKGSSRRVPGSTGKPS